MSQNYQLTLTCGYYPITLRCLFPINLTLHYQIHKNLCFYALFCHFAFYHFQFPFLFCHFPIKLPVDVLFLLYFLTFPYTGPLSLWPHARRREHSGPRPFFTFLKKGSYDESKYVVSIWSNIISLFLHRWPSLSNKRHSNS